MFVRVTGGISRGVGALKELVETLEFGRRHVRTIGGCNNVDIAFRPDSATDCRPLRVLLSKTPPMLVIELSFDSLRK